MTTSAVQRFATKEPTLCAVCRRRAVWLGYAPHQSKPILWLCDHVACLEYGRAVYTMPKETLDAYEIGAAREAIDVAGPYLDRIGQTDLAKLDSVQLDEFMRLLLTGFEQSMRRKIANKEAPF